MATYANDLRLKEIGTGDEDGAWGTSTNTNLSLIADAFGYGTKQLAADANETFTIPDATADGTRALYLKITSAVSLSATRTVTLGPNTVSKVWIIENATTGSQSIEIKQGSGATVTIATGAKAMVYTDGAGAGAAVTLANFSVTQANVTGLTTADSPQFTGINLGHASDTTLTRVSAGVVAVEGVNLVLTGGALGTPSSGTLTNCTGLPQAGVVGLTTADSPQFAGINLGHASDTTFTRVSAGIAAIEGVNILLTSTAQNVSNKTFLDTPVETGYTISDGAAFEIDPGNGSRQTITLGASRTPKATNFADGETIRLRIAGNNNGYTITWTDATFGGSGVVWVGGSAPAIATSGYTIVVLWKDGTQVYGTHVGDVA